MFWKEGTTTYNEIFPSRDAALRRIKEMIPKEMIKYQMIVIRRGLADHSSRYMNYYIFSNKISCFSVKKGKSEDSYIGNIFVINGTMIEEELTSEKSAYNWSTSMIKRIGGREQLFFFNGEYCLKNKVFTIATDEEIESIEVKMIGDWKSLVNFSGAQETMARMDALIKEIEG
ncbi:MAG: hypothetical protein ACOYMB_04140 [Patescibacteria group bacterium]